MIVMRRRLSPRCLILASLVLVITGPALAERLPFRAYTTSEGLARDFVSCIVQDSRGFIWFCTNEGLSRFDGYSFTNFGKENGLGGQNIYDLMEARDGTIWAATEEGLSRLDPAARPRLAGTGETPSSLFRTFVPRGRSANIIRTLLQSRDGAIWAGTWSGLFRFDPQTEDFETVDLGDPNMRDEWLQVNDLLEEPNGALWIATRYLGLIRRHADGKIERFLHPIVPPEGTVRALAFDGEGGLWAGGYDGLAHLVPRPNDRSMIVAERYVKSDGLADKQIYALQRMGDGRLAVAGSFGLSIVSPQKGARAKILSMGAGKGLTLLKALALGEDRAGNLWIGSDGAGAWKLARDGFTTYGASDGLPDLPVVSFFHDRRGRLYASAPEARPEWAITRLEDPPFHTTRIILAPEIKSVSWGISQLTLQDRHGDWWVPTGQGLVRFTGVPEIEQLASATPRAIYTVKDGLPHNDIFRLFEDSRADIWVSGVGGTARFDRASGRFVTFEGGAHAFGEDAAGDVWAGYWDGSVRRFRHDRFERFGARDGVPAGNIQSLFLDSRGRFWIGSSDGGAARVDAAAAARPVFKPYAIAEGLPSRQVNCFAEDLWGRIYMGTGRGLVVLEPETGRVRHFTKADGLAGNDVQLAARDTAGAIWFGMQEGVSRLSPQAPESRRPPSIFISEVSLSGVRQAMNLFGERAVEGILLSPDQRQIEIAFVGIDFSAGERLRYQHRLEGADADWSPPGDRRSVNYARLAPGRYLFAVRSVDSDGQGSLVPATVSFSIMTPVWQRWWFLALSVAVLAALTYAFYRYRLGHALRLERVRAHIATDLHDDIGASLSQIAILNEVALTRLQSGSGDASGPLATAAQAAREVVDSMSDVVWAVDPKRDRLEDLVLRMRRFAEELCAARDIELRFDTTPDGARRLDAQARRQIYLLFKESLNNAVKHSGCAVIGAELTLDANRLELRVADDGRGFDPRAAHEGHGLASMRRRSEALGGEVRIRSGLGQGTEIRFSIPV